MRRTEKRLELTRMAIPRPHNRALVSWARAITFRNAVSARFLSRLSGGIDSALVAAIAKDALGAENVLALGNASPYSSAGSIATAAS